MLLVWLGIAMIGNSVAGSSIAAGYSLDLANRTIVKTVGREVTNPQAMKFVQIAVAEVFNPRKIPLSFSVYYQPANGEKFLLGTFSLFPPDKPGTFIVATRGKLRTGGMVIVSIVPLKRVNEETKMRAQIGRISFVEAAR